MTLEIAGKSLMTGTDLPTPESGTMPNTTGVARRSAEADQIPTEAELLDHLALNADQGSLNPRTVAMGGENADFTV